ncbi:MAG: hypothetical protein LBP33_10650 [Candidatus Adiutrix sp.]|nr:hypothetical protein [Candidatus Adiutrix sp.]
MATRAEAALKIPDLSPQLWMLYAFQLIRIYFYAGEHDLVIEFFENDLAHKPATAPLEWCRSYYGGSLHARDRNVEAFAAFAAVFHRSARYGPSALASLHITDWPLRGDRARPASNEGGKTIYSEPELKWLQTATPEEAALYRSARNFIGGDPHEALAGVLSLIEHGGRIPNNLEEYLVAAIGRMERKAYRPIGIHWHIYTSAPVEYGSDPPDPAPEPDLERRLLKIGAGRPHPALWQLAAAHLAIMRRDEKAAAGYIDTAATNNAGSLMPIQLQITRLLKDAWLKPLDAANERRLADDLSKLDLLLAETVNFYHPGAIARRALWESVLARRFHEAGQDARAFFCLEVVNTRLFNSFNPSAALEKGPHSIRRAENDMDSTEQPRELFTIPYSNALYWAGEYIAMLLSDPADLKEIRRIRLKPEGALELYFQKNVVGWTPRVIDELTGLAYINRFDYQPAIKVLRGISSQGWAQRRYKEKTPLASSPESLKRVLRDTYRRHFSRNTNWNERSALANVNPFRESPASLFGPLWVDDFSALFDAAARAGLSEHSRETILKLSNPPATFLEFAQKMNRLKELSREHGELGATSAYFYALAVYNSAEYPNWRQNCEQYGADQEVDRMLILLVKKTRNRELAARANFIRAAFRKYEAGFTYNRKTKVISYNKFDVIEPYFQVLSGLKDTKFAHDISFHCPSVGLFLK